MASAIEFGASPEGVQSLALKRANRHGLIAGATGTGKTVTLQVLAEAFAREGVNVFAADIKGDLSGCAATDATPPGWATARAAEINLPLTPEAAPAVFWDVYGELGHPVRTTVTEMGPVLMGRVLEATDAQAGALTIAFRIADDWIKEGRNEGLLLDINDLRAMLTYLSENAEDIGKQYGLVTPQSIAALQRKLLQLEMDGAERFFGEPALKLEELLKPRPDGKGTIHVLASERLVQSPRLYSAFLLWLMSELWEELPEVGDQDKPKLVFFFDEAHLLFRDAPKELINKVEQVVRLIRSKGVGIYFVTQSPTDIPEIVLSQLGNRFQHALRAYTPTDQKAVRAAAQSFRANENVDVAKEIQELGVGEALVSTLDEKGAPTPVARTKIRPPNGHVGPILLAERQALMRANTAGRVYEKAENRDSAYEILTRRIEKLTREEEREAEREAKEKRRTPAPRERTTTSKRSSPQSRSSAKRDGILAQAGRSIVRLAETFIERNVIGTPRRRR
jgi:DNA helicase HerA-like ATPase